MARGRAKALPVALFALLTVSVSPQPADAADPVGAADVGGAAGAPVGTLAATPAVARNASTLPPLGNTTAGDRLLMREIGDEHVYAPPRDALSAGETTGTPSAPITGLHGGSAGTLPAAIGPAAPVHPGRPDEAARAQAGRGADAADVAVPATLAGMTAPVATSPAAPRDNTVAPLATTRADARPLDPWARIRSSTRWARSERPEVQAFREQYVREARWVNKLLARGNIFIDYLVQQLDERYLPLELALLPAIESGFRPEVISRGQAAGLWQIVPGTAREIGLQRTTWFDGRADTVSSTRAAIDYLSYLNAEFHGDWELTLAAYNAGPGRVRRAVQANRARGEPADFWSLSLPAETRAYVPKLLALVDLVKAQDGGLQLPERTPVSGFVDVEVGARIGLAEAAELADVPLDDLERLNGGLLHGVTAPDGPHRVSVPAAAAALFNERLAAVAANELFSLPRQHRVVSGDTLSGIARHYGMPVSRLMQLNSLEHTRIRAGQSLDIVPGKGHGTAEIEYVVSIGDTLSSIAQRHSVARAAIHDAEGRALDDDLIHPGEVLTIRFTGSAAGHQTALK